MEGLARELVSVQLAVVAAVAEGRAVDDALLLPGLVVVQLADGAGILHPLDDLGHGNEVNVLLVPQSLVQPVEEGVENVGIVLQEGRVEEQTEGSAVGFVVTVEVVLQEVEELLGLGLGGEAGVHHVASWEAVLVGGLLATVHLVHDHLPHREGASRAVLEVSVAGMGHTVVQGVGPQGLRGQGGGDGGVVQEGVLLHHLELAVSAHTEEGITHSDDGLVGDVGESFDDDTSTTHFAFVLVFACVGPESLVVCVAGIET